MSFEAAQAAITGAIPVIVAAGVARHVAGTVGVATKKKRAKVAAKKTKAVKPKVARKTKKEASKMTTRKARPYASVVVGSKAEAEKIQRRKAGAETIRVTISKAPKSRALTSSDWLVEFWEKRKDSKDGSEVVIRTVEEKERSRSRTSKPKMPKESRSKSGTIETRGRRGHIRL